MRYFLQLLSGISCFILGALILKDLLSTELFTSDFRPVHMVVEFVVCAVSFTISAILIIRGCKNVARS